MDWEDRDKTEPFGIIITRSGNPSDGDIRVSQPTTRPVDAGFWVGFFVLCGIALAIVFWFFTHYRLTSPPE